MALKLMASALLRMLISVAMIGPTNQQGGQALKVNWLVRKTPLYAGDSAQDLLDLCPDGCGAECSITDCNDDAIASLRHAQNLVGGLVEAINEPSLAPLLLKWCPLVIVALMGSFLFWKKHFVWGNLIDGNVMGGTGGIYHRVYLMMKFEVKVTPPEERHQQPKLNRQSSVIKQERMKILERTNEEGFGLGLLSEAYHAKPETMISHSFNPMSWELEKLGEIRLQPMRLKKREIRSQSHDSDVSTDSIESNNNKYYDTVFVDPDGSDSDEYNILETHIDGGDQEYENEKFLSSLKQLRGKGDRLKKYAKTQQGGNESQECQLQHHLYRIKYANSSSDQSDDD